MVSWLPVQNGQIAYVHKQPSVGSTEPFTL